LGGNRWWNDMHRRLDLSFHLKLLEKLSGTALGGFIWIFGIGAAILPLLRLRPAIK
jgi:hypothetical protein